LNVEPCLTRHFAHGRRVLQAADPSPQEIHVDRLSRIASDAQEYGAPWLAAVLALLTALAFTTLANAPLFS